MARLGMSGATVRVVSGSLGAVGITFIAMVNSASLPASLVLIALVGGPATAYTIAVQTLLQIYSEDAFRGRVFATYGSVTIFALLIGMVSASFLAGVIPLVDTLNAAGAIFLVAAVLGWRIRVPTLIAPAADPESDAAASV